MLLPVNLLGSAWIEPQSDDPSRPEAMRRLLAQALRPQIAEVEVTRLADRVLRDLRRRGDLQTQDRVLSVCGGAFEREVFQSAGIEHATITNIDQRYDNSLAPYSWSFQDAERLSFEDESFDVTFVHAGLHHCHSPHRALLEMYRVARKAVVVIENRDSLLMQIAVKLGLAPDYEIEAVTAGDPDDGGVRNSHIPNFIYRWTEAEVLKTVKCYEPRFMPRVRFFYHLRLPHERLEGSGQSMKAWLLRAATPLARLLFALFPRQSNEFAFVIFKDRAPVPWLVPAGDDYMLCKAKVRAMGRLFTT